MNSTSYLLFALGDTPYGLAAEVVQEIFLLPALTSVPEVGPEVVGVLNLRGQLLPVLNLRLFLGHPTQPNSLGQAVVLVQHRGQRVGLVVDHIQNVEAIAPHSITTTLETPYIGNTEHSLTAGLAQYADSVIILLNPAALVQGAADVAPAGATPRAETEGTANRFMAQFEPVEQQVLRRRAAELAQLLATENASDQSALAIVSLAGEQFALGLETVHEFTNVSQVTPIPCCPSHIVGNMNLRGEILTLIDVRRFLNLPPAAAAPPHKAVVMRLGSLVAGVVVDDVFDVVYVNALEVAVMPTAVHSNETPYLRGVARYGDTMMSLLDLPTLLTQGELVVDQSG
ncbi:chemotaxis protein CheW [Nodosilinea sp. LEGE 06152]|uniref:chemotaxis protein CheW n=1 Tax=Nodosilinea sp. LEGE 06152 TaxID=2777966 RepID=UPI00188160A7|nr:chemotaxis protein CheW [Nodosilinea sp. LEGE 06152]MBE9156119.1 chemotaxis protein CheW [Nodosilinea sp. LEGE 06152]